MSLLSIPCCWNNSRRGLSLFDIFLSRLQVHRELFLLDIFLSRLQSSYANAFSLAYRQHFLIDHFCLLNDQIRLCKYAMDRPPLALHAVFRGGNYYGGQPFDVLAQPINSERIQRPNAAPGAAMHNVSFCSSESLRSVLYAVEL